jgi:hypothetical protein
MYLTLNRILDSHYVGSFTSGLLKQDASPPASERGRTIQRGPRHVAGAGKFEILPHVDVGTLSCNPNDGCTQNVRSEKQRQ